MDGVNLLSDQVANDWYNRIKAAHVAEGQLINLRRPKQVSAWWATHDLLKDLADALGIDGGVQPMSGGTDKPPRPV